MNDWYNNVVDFFKGVDKLALLFSIFVISKTLGFLPFQIPSIIGYGYMGIMALYVLKKTDNTDFLFLLFVIYLGINVLISDYAVTFQSGMRLAIFVILLICISPLTKGAYVESIRITILKILLNLSVFFSVISFVCWFLGINFMVTRYLNIEVAGHFGGIFKHSMLLGPIAGMSSLYMIYKAFTLKKIYYIVFAVMCIGALFFSASRTALVSLVIAVLLLLVKMKVDRSLKIKVLVASTFLLLTSFPIWSEYTELMVQKNNTNLAKGGVFSSRDAKWNARITEFENNPVMGIGFACIDLRLDQLEEEGNVEPGSSWLVVLSMTGIIGFVFVIVIFFMSYRNCVTADDDRSLLLSLLCFMSVSMITEGYVFSAGSYMAILLWLIIGCCNNSECTFIG